MSYRAATPTNPEPHIYCDSCQITHPVTPANRPGIPYAWFLKGSHAPGWQGKRNDDGTRTDKCGRCVWLDDVFARHTARFFVGALLDDEDEFTLDNAHALVEAMRRTHKSAIEIVNEALAAYFAPTDTDNDRG